MSEIRIISDRSQGCNPQGADGKEEVTCKVPRVAERILYKFERGVLERYIASEYGIKREFVEALVRREYRRLAAENRQLRRAA